jgi:hypothetical protein
MVTYKSSGAMHDLAGRLRLLAAMADALAPLVDSAEIPSAAPAAAVPNLPATGGVAATNSPAVADVNAEEAATPAGSTASASPAARRGNKRAAIEAALRANPDASVEEIMAVVGCSRSHISMIRAELFPSDSKKK